MADIKEVREAFELINNGIDDAVQLTEKLSNHSSKYLESLETLDSSININIGKWDNMSITLEGLSGQVNRSSTANSDLLGSMNDHISNFEQISELVLPDDAKEQVEELNMMPQEISDGLGHQGEVYSDLMGDVFVSISDYIDLFVQESTNVLERANNFSSDIENATEQIVQESENAVNEIRDALEIYGENINTNTGDIKGELENAMQDELQEVMNNLSDGGMESFASMNEKIESLFGEAKEALNDVNEAFDSVNDLAEPVLPILDTISAISG